MLLIVRHLQALTHDERGQTAIAIVLSFMGVFMIAGLALDGGFWYFHHRNTQNWADAAVLAAVQELPADTTAATEAAIEWLKQNRFPDAAADAIEVGTGTDCGDMTIPNGQDAKAKILYSDGDSIVKVCLRSNSRVFLTGLASVTEARVSASAKAMVEPPPPVPFTLVALNKENSCDAMVVAGNSDVDITGGSSYTGGLCNTSCPTSSGTLHLNGNNSLLTMTGGNHYVVDGTCGVFDNFDNISPVPLAGVDSINDPFASLTQPPPTLPPADLVTVCPLLPCIIPCTPPGGSNWVPGIYCGPGNTRLVVGSSASVNLAAGMYIFPRGLTVDGNMSGDNVLLYGTCATTSSTTRTCCPTYPGTCLNSPPGSIEFKADGVLDLTGRSDRGSILVEMDRTAPAASRPACNPSQPPPNTPGTVSFSGNQANKLTNAGGVVYAAGSTVTFSGQAGSNGGDIAVVADKICLSGQANLGGTQVEAPPPGEFVYTLIE